MTVSNLSSEVDLMHSRIGQDFDGECHLTAEEAERIASGISSLLERNERLTKALHRANWMFGQHQDYGTPFGKLPVEEVAHEVSAALETQDRGSASHD